jgi:hypothetical protein
VVSQPHLPAKGSGISYLIERLFLRGSKGSRLRQNVWRTPLPIRGTLAEHLNLKRSEAKSRQLAGPLCLIGGFETTSGKFLLFVIFFGHPVVGAKHKTNND